ncbi:MAG: PHP domain-containing protein [Aquificaceae bacterium]
MNLFLLLILLLFLYLLIAEIYPLRRFKAKRISIMPSKMPNLYLYSFQVHLHSQFSYDSLGKPGDILESAKEEGIDYVMTTDHNNDHIRLFADKRLIAGMEKKVNNEKGQILGDLLIFDDLRIIAHPFKEKYRWKPPISKDYLLEIVDLKDALFERKLLLFFFAPYIIFKALFSMRSALEIIKKLINIEKCALLYMDMGIDNPIVGGLDHHVKLYIREVGVRFIFPHYRHSFGLMRNFLLSEEKVEEKESFLKNLKKGKVVVSFSEKPLLYWKEESLKVSPPRKCLLVELSKEGKEVFYGSYFEVRPKPGINLYLGYTYKLSLGSLYFGLKPLFIFLWKEVEDGRTAPAGGHKGEDPSEGLQ